LARLPKAISADRVTRLLKAFDRSSATGKRDYAITRCFIDLGLRTIEVARLRLDDFDWRHNHRVGKWLALANRRGLTLTAARHRLTEAFTAAGDQRDFTLEIEGFMEHCDPRKLVSIGERGRKPPDFMS